MVSKKKGTWEETKYIKQTLPNENTSHGGNDDQNWEIRNISIDHIKHGKHNIDIIRKPNQKIFGQRMYPDRQKNNPTCHN